MSEEYYFPQDVVFNRDQVIWILRHREVISDGEWPTPPTGVVFTGTKRGHRAYFETPCLVWGELERRLRQVGRDRYLVEDYYCQGISYGEIARSINADEIYVERYIWRALNYMSSGSVPRWIETKKRKAIEYSEWCQHRKQTSRRIAGLNWKFH